MSFNDEAKIKRQIEELHQQIKKLRITKKDMEISKAFPLGMPSLPIVICFSQVTAATFCYKEKKTKINLGPELGEDSQKPSLKVSGLATHLMLHLPGYSAPKERGKQLCVEGKLVIEKLSLVSDLEAH